MLSSNIETVTLEDIKRACRMVDSGGTSGGSLVEMVAEIEEGLAPQRQSSGLLLEVPPECSQAEILCEALKRLSAVTISITGNVRLLNNSLERILVDKPDVEELERILNNFSWK